jgi:hypothetical protein
MNKIRVSCIFLFMLITFEFVGIKNPMISSEQNDETISHASQGYQSTTEFSEADQEIRLAMLAHRSQM